MLRVGLTGNIGSGKTIVAGIFSTLGIPVFYADNAAKSLYSHKYVKAQLRQIFGHDIFTVSGEIDRKILAGIIFNDDDKLREINDLIHPLVWNAFSEWVDEKQGVPYVIYEAAILFETGHYQDLDKIVLVAAPEEVRIQRVMNRDGITREDIIARMKNQWDEDRKLPLADYVIRNDGHEMLIPQVMEAHSRLMLNV